MEIVPGIRYEFVKSNGEGSFRQFNTDLAGNILYDTITNESFSSSVFAELPAKPYPMAWFFMRTGRRTP